MPWKTESTMDQKVQLIADWLTNQFAKTDLSQKYQVSRPTIDKWLQRYRQEGLDGLKERSCVPKSCPQQTSDAIINMIVAQKCKNLKRGPKKVIAHLQRHYPHIAWPAPSTAGEWLKKYDLVRPKKRRYRVAPYTQPFMHCRESNTVWSADYKGQFYTQDKKVCYPLTISDNFSRYLFKCQGLAGPRYKATKAVFETAFQEYGLPDAIRTDNGVPFASKCIGGLSRLSKWFILLGIVPERIKKGCPSQNGRHERMHRTLKEETLDPIRANMSAQQKIFDRFRVEYNTQRPHEALKQQCPSDYYRPSLRKYSKRLPAPEYDMSMSTRRVCDNGHIYFKGGDYYVSKLLGKDTIGLKEYADGYWVVYFSFQPIGILDMRKNKIINKIFHNQKV